MRQCRANADHDGSDSFGLQLLKVQDTIPIHACIMSQKVAENSLSMGQQYTLEKIESLRPNRELLLDALSPLGTLGDGVWGGDAIYLFARLPEGRPASPLPPQTYAQPAVDLCASDSRGKCEENGC